MDTIRFIGNLYPKGLTLSAILPSLDWDWEEENKVLSFRVNIYNSTINVECTIDKFEDRYLVELHRRAFDLARTAANLACFAVRHGLTAVFEFVILPNGTPVTLRYVDQNLPQPRSCSLESKDMQKMADISTIVVTDPLLFLSLNDLIECLTTPHVAPINCGRIVDRIRRQIAPSADGVPAWIEMQMALNLSPAYQKFVTQLSRGPRHGDPTPVPSLEARESLTRTWNIMDRYLEYRWRRNVPLTPPEFPALD
jgi:hypothetical protein